MDVKQIREEWVGFFPEKAPVKLAEDRPMWDEVLERCEEVDVLYTWASLIYEREYLRGTKDQVIDLSVVFCDKNQHSIGVWPVALEEKDGVFSFSTYGAPVLAPIFVKEATQKQIKAAYKAAYFAIKQMAAALRGKQCEVAASWRSWYSTHLLDKVGDSIGWYHLLMEEGAKASVVSYVYMDITKDLEELHHSIRKRFRSMINKGLKMWHVQVLTEISKEEFEEFHQFHIEVAGRVTRSADTWDLQYKAVNDGDAFCIYMRDDNNKLIGAGFYSVSKDECLYGVGVYDRSLFDKPVGHVVHWTAIEHMKKLGVKRFYIGWRPYPGEDPTPTEKEMNIGYNKEGFATHEFPRIVLHNPL